MSICKISDTEWEHQFAGDLDNEYHEIKATQSGLYINGNVISWEEIDQAREKSTEQKSPG